MDDDYIAIAGALLVLAFICPPAKEPPVPTIPAGTAAAAAAAFMGVAVCLAVLTIFARLSPGRAVGILPANLGMIIRLDRLLISAATAAAAASVALRASV